MIRSYAVVPDGYCPIAWVKLGRAIPERGKVMLFENGTYAANMIRQSVWEKAETGTLNMTGVFQIGDNELKHNFNLVLKDGTINTKTIAFLKDVFSWDGVDFAALQHGDFSQVPLECVCENNAENFTNIRYVNKPGGKSGSTEMPENTDARSLSAKYGAKFRAVSGGVPAGKPTTKPAPKAEAAPAPAPVAPAPVPAKKSPPNRPAASKPQGQVSSEADCWAKAVSLRPDDPEEAQAIFFWDNIANVVGDKTTDITPQEWGKIMATLTENLPF